MFSKFRCCACGSCCSNIKGLISQEEKKFIEEYGYGKLPLIQLTPVDQITFPLWDFEAARFREYEKQFEVDAKIIPSRGVLDLKSDTFIIVTYQMSTENACPFLNKDGKCRIYETQRAFICRLFPFNRTPFLNIGSSNNANLFGKCDMLSNIANNLNYKDKEILIKQLHEAFGKDFLSAVQHDYIIEWSNKIILSLIKKELIKPALNYPYHFLRKRIENSKKIDFTEFLQKVDYFTSNEVQQLVLRFESLEDAKLKIKPFV